MQEAAKEKEKKRMSKQIKFILRVQPERGQKLVLFVNLTFLIFFNRTKSLPTSCYIFFNFLNILCLLPKQ